MSRNNVLSVFGKLNMGVERNKTESEVKERVRGW